MESNKSELEKMVKQIKSETKQIAINKVDEVNIMRTMLNDKNFSIGVYDKNSGYVGQRCPHDEAVLFVKNVINGATGLDTKDSKVLAEGYEFTKKDANFLLTNMRDFISVYMTTGRKINIMQNAQTEASLYTKEMPEGEKCIPDKEHPGKSKRITTAPYVKLVSSTRAPKYTDKV